MVLFDRAISRNLFLPLALVAYDTSVDPDTWSGIGFAPQGPILIDYHALDEAMAQEALHQGGLDRDNLLRFRNDFANDNAEQRDGAFFGWVALNESTRTAVITFRGTHGFDEWVKDALIAPVPYPYARIGGLVHAGFLIVYKSVRKSTIDLLMSIPTAKYDTLLICGHSLGASVATISAADVGSSIKNRANPKVRTFASPRPGDLLFARQLIGSGTTVLTHRNRWDIVPDLPILPYVHTDTIVLIDGGGFGNPRKAHDLTASYQHGLERLVSDSSQFGGLPSHPYIYSESQ